MTMLNIEQLSFAYSHRRVVDLWSAEFAPGLLWLRGANGTGKSTRLKLLAGALAPQFGSAQLLGVDLVHEPLAYRRLVSWVGADAPVFEHLSPAERFAFLARLYPQADAQAFAQHVQGFGLAPFLQRPLRELSTGTQHKAALACAMALQTPLLLLDEPLNALDASAQSYLRAWLTQAAGRRHHLCVVVSHEALGLDPRLHCATAFLE